MKLQEVLGREPTDEELGDELGFSAQKVAQLRTAAIRPASLEAPLGDDETSRIADVVRDETADTPYEQLEDKTNNSMLRELVATLDRAKRRFSVIVSVWMASTNGRWRKWARKFGVTRERIRQIQNVALAKLRKQIEKLETVRVAA